MRFRRRFSLLVAGLLVVPSLLTSVFLFVSIRQHDEDVTRRYLASQVRQASGTIDTVFSKLQADFVFLAYRDELLHLKRWAEESDYREKKQFLKNLDPFGTLADYYDSALLVNADDGWLVDVKNKSLSPLAGTRYEDVVDRELAVFRNRAQGNAILFSFQGTEGRSTYLVRKIDFPAVGRSLYLCVQISEAFFRKVVDDTFLGERSFLAIFERGGTLVSLRARGVDLDEPRVTQLAQNPGGPTGRYWIARTTSEATGWQYVYGTDRRVVENSLVGHLAWATGLVSALLVILGLASLVVSRRLYSPLGRLFQVFQSEDREPDDLESLTRRASVLVESHQRLQESLVASQTGEQENFLRTFFDDPALPAADFPTVALARGLNLDFSPGSAWAVCLVHASPDEGRSGGLFDEAKDAGAFLARFFVLAPGVRAQVFRPGHGRVGLLLSLPGAGPVVTDLVRAGPALAAGTVLAFSPVSHDWAGLKTAYREAEVAMNYRPLAPERAVIRYEDVAGPSSWFFYPFDREQKLLVALKQASESAVMDAYGLFLDSLRLSGVSFGAVKHVFCHLADSLWHVAREFDVVLDEGFHDTGAPLWDRIMETSDPPEVELLMRRFLQALLAGLLQKKRSTFDILAQTAHALIEERYADYALSLDSISQELRYSTSHLSAVFRAAYGQTIKDFITQVRLDRACELLVSTNHKIGRVAELVGYLNAGSFVKIFKTYRGETPKTFKLRHRAGTIT